MRFLPVGLNIHNKKILMVGGGEVAAHKLAALLKFTKKIYVVAPEILPEIKKSGVVCREKAYERKDLEGFGIVYACTDQRDVNRRVCADARRHGCLVNVADDPSRCDFISPAIYKKGHMTVAVGSDGRAVKKAVAWRDRIRKVYDNDNA